MMPRYRAIRLRRRYRERTRRTYARFYGAYKNMVGQTRGFEFQVKVTKLSNRAIYKLVHFTAGRIKNNNLPYHQRRETFSSFAELLGSKWVRVRKVLHYDTK